MARRVDGSGATGRDFFPRWEGRQRCLWRRLWGSGIRSWRCWRGRNRRAFGQKVVADEKVLVAVGEVAKGLFDEFRFEAGKLARRTRLTSEARREEREERKRAQRGPNNLPVAVVGQDGGNVARILQVNLLALRRHA